jgi:hypothetical protein
MRATQHFHRGLLLLSQRKEFQRNTLKYFWSFCFSEESKKQEREKLFTWESSQQTKEEREIFLGFLLIVLLNRHRKEN